MQDSAPHQTHSGDERHQSSAKPSAVYGLLALILALLFVGVEGWRQGPPAGPARADWPHAGETRGLDPSTLTLQAAGRIPMPDGVPAAHASSLLAMPASDAAVLQAYWFAGSRESAPDVNIVMSSYDRASRGWTPAQVVVDRADLSAGLGFIVRRLGNPVAWRDARGRTHLFVVATGLGGWAAGRIVQLRQDRGGERFQVVRVLPLSWFWNTSHLVRALPLPLADGGMVLPAYFELGYKYPVALRFDSQGEMTGMVRMSAHRDLLQPTLLPTAESDWLALMRDNRAERRMRAARTPDGGAHWIDLPDPGPANPDASMVGLALRPDLLLLAHNPVAESRARLVLSSSGNGQLWTVQTTLADGAPGSEHSYPSLAWADGSLWVSYTDDRRAIAWQRFSPQTAQKGTP